MVEGRIAETRVQAEGEAGERVVLGESEAGEIVKGVLDRVWVMRVFDWWGVVEAVGEVREHVEGQVELQGAAVVEGGGGESGNGDAVKERKKQDGSVVEEGGGGGQELMVESSPLSSPPSSLLSSPSPLPRVVPLFPQPHSPLHPPRQVPGVVEIPDSDAESDEEILVPESRQYSPLHGVPVRSQGSQLPHEIPGSSDEGEDDALPSSPFQPTYAHARGNTEISFSGHRREDITTAQVPSSPPPAAATAAEPPHIPEPAIGILVIDTITHPVEALINKAASSSGYSGGSGGTVPAGVAGAYALLERYFRELSAWVKEWGIAVLVSLFVRGIVLRGYPEMKLAHQSYIVIGK